MKNTPSRYVWFIIGLTLLSIHLDALSLQPNDETNPLEIRENLRDLLASIHGNDLKNIEKYRNILGQEAAREKQIFDGVKGSWRSTHERKAVNLPNVHHKSEQVVAFKREVKEPGDSNQCKAAEAERADQFAKEYMEVIGDEVNATWDLYRNQATDLVKHGESEDCSASIANKPLCNVCSHAINKTILTREKTARPLSATFLQGWMEFPHSNFEVKRKLIDVIMCTHEPPVAGGIRLYLTRGKYSESAFGLDKVKSGDGKDDTYILNGRWISWYNEDHISHNVRIDQL